MVGTASSRAKKQPTRRHAARAKLSSQRTFAGRGRVRTGINLRFHVSACPCRYKDARGGPQSPTAAAGGHDLIAARLPTTRKPLFRRPGQSPPASSRPARAHHHLRFTITARRLLGGTRDEGRAHLICPSSGARKHWLRSARQPAPISAFQYHALEVAYSSLTYRPLNITDFSQTLSYNAIRTPSPSTTFCLTPSVRSSYPALTRQKPCWRWEEFCTHPACM